MLVKIWLKIKDYFLSKQFFDDPNDNYDYDQGNDDI